MADGEDEFSSSFDSSDESFPSGSSPSSNTSFSETNSTDVGSVGDLQPLGDERIYGWIFSLIKEGKVARFVDRQQGIYEMDWQTVVYKYWFEWRGSRRDLKSKSVRNIKFSHRTASNTLRAALLNAYKDKGAVEFAEKKVLDSRSKPIKRCFRLPSTMIHKFARHHHFKASSHTCTSVASTKRTKTSRDELQGKDTLSLPLHPLDLDSLDVDVKESDSLIDDINKMLDPEDPLFPSNSHAFTRTSTPSDGMASNYDDAGYDTLEGSSEENLVKEIDPSEGPYQGGNTAFIFLEDSRYTCFAEAGNRYKVVFFDPKQRELTAREVTATVKNCFTIKVCVPHCPRAELAFGKLTVHVHVNTLDGRYIGETKYTYNSNLVAQFEHCVKALDDKDMELDFTGSTDEEQVTLNYTQWDTQGCHMFNFASLRVLVFVAVKIKAYNFLTAFLRSPAAWSVLEHCKHKLLTFLEAVRGSSEQSERRASVLDCCERLLVSDTFKCETTEHREATVPSQGAKANASQEEMGKTEKGYNSGSELKTDQESEEEVNDGNDVNCLHVEHREVTEENEACKDTSVENKCILAPEDTIVQQEKAEKKQVNDSPNNKPKMFVLRKPCSPVPISRSRSSFPDPRTDVFVELQVRKSQKENSETSEHVPHGSPQVMQHVPITKHHVIVDVRHSGTEESAKDWESKYVKRVSGKIGYWFRFYKPNCELLLMFKLCDKPHAATKTETKLRTAAFEVLDRVTVVVETTSWKGPFSRDAKEEQVPDKLEFSLTQHVPLVSLSRSQTRLCTIMNSLHKFCDNGDWRRFETACTHLQHKFPSADIKVAILLEKAIVFLYQHNLEKAEETALEALKIAFEAENHQLLAGRAYYYLAHVYRRECKLGEAERCIDLSKQNLHLMDICLDQSFMAYEEGNVMKDFISSGAVLKKTLVRRAKQCFERCLDLCKRLDDSDSSVIPPTHSFALIKIAMLLLDCGSTSGRERCVSVNHIQEAKRFLDLLQRRGLDEITERRKIQFLLACSDLQYRMCNYQMAIRNAEVALKKANQLGFALEVMPARKRLTHICQLLASSGYTLEL